MPICPISVTFFFSVHSRYKSMPNRISRIRVTAKKTSQREQPFSVQSSSLFLRAFVSSRGEVKDTRFEAKDPKKSEAKDSPSKDRPFRGQGQERSWPRPMTIDQGHRRKCSPKKKVFKNFFRAISNGGTQQRSSQIFREIFRRCPTKF